MNAIWYLFSKNENNNILQENQTIYKNEWFRKTEKCCSCKIMQTTLAMVLFSAHEI